MSITRIKSEKDGLAAVDFLARLFANTNHSIELRALPSKSRCFTRDNEKLRRFVETHHQENLYFGCATRDAQGGTKQHCRELTALWVDLDYKLTPEPQARALLASFPLKGSVVLQSGGGLHVYWLLVAVVDAHDKRVEPILRGLAAALEADPAAAEIARVMRLPGTYSHKYDPPRDCRVVEADWGRRYTLGDFEKFAERQRQAHKQPTDGAQDIIIDGRRNVALTSIAGKMRRHIGMDDAEILNALLSINARRCVPPLPRNEVEGIVKSTGRYASAVPMGGESANTWSLAVGMDTFLAGEDAPLEFMEPRAVAKGNITEVFSPRGLGKSLWATYVAVKQAKLNRKVLLIDRDNPRRVVKERLRAFGATSDLVTLKFLSRENAPPLTKTEAWEAFPYAEYDLVIVDSLDSVTEGVGEQDSAKPSRAVAPLLDIAHRQDGPAVLLLGNCVRAATHARGSGIIEDRADIVFEVRDATNFQPSGKRPWIEELPPADAKSWVSRSLRRRQQEKYRLAFVPTKFRIGEEPDPFILEIDLTSEPWSIQDVTDDVDRQGAAEREREAKDRAARIQDATHLLKAEIIRRERDGKPVLLRKQAEEFATSLGFKQKIAREAIHSPEFATVEVAGRGHPKGVRIADKSERANRNATHRGASVYGGSSGDDFSQPHKQSTTETGHQETKRLPGFQEAAISVEPFLSDDAELNQDREILEI